MVMKLYGHPFSTCTNRVLTVLKETKTPYEFSEVGLLQGAHKAPEHLAKHPFGQVPVLEDNGLVLYESRAIARYIAAKAGSPLLPSGDLAKVAAFEVAASVELSNFDHPASNIGYQRLVVPMRGMKTDEEQVAALITNLEAKLAGYEVILSKSKYLAGDDVTLADLFHLPAGDRLAAAGVTLLQDAARFPHVARWWTDISSRPSWQDVLKSVKPPQLA